VTADAYDALVKVAGPVSRETFSRLTAFVDRFLRWNKITNLVASSTVDEIWQRHICDSAQLRALAPEARLWVDLGSGGGFPGLIMAILLRDMPGASVHLVESNRKKTSFLQSIVGEFGLPATVHSRRIEETYESIGMVDAVSSRALAALPQLLALSEPWLSASARGYFHKGRDYQREIKESLPAWRFDLIEHPSAIESQSVILEISDLARV
jgi:16S rRNA (guanine527-N7)-methyltransferase